MNKRQGPGNDENPIREAAAASKSAVDVCDFCATPSPSWRYEAQPFARSLAGSSAAVLFDAFWAACEVCHRLIEDGQWARLLRRHERLNPTAMDPVVATETAALWQQFDQRRIGRAVRIGGAVS